MSQTKRCEREVAERRERQVAEGRAGKGGEGGGCVCDGNTSRAAAAEDVYRCMYAPYILYILCTFYSMYTSVDVPVYMLHPT